MVFNANHLTTSVRIPLKTLWDQKLMIRKQVKPKMNDDNLIPSFCWLLRMRETKTDCTVAILQYPEAPDL